MKSHRIEADRETDRETDREADREDSSCGRNRRLSPPCRSCFPSSFLGCSVHKVAAASAGLSFFFLCPTRLWRRWLYVSSRCPSHIFQISRQKSPTSSCRLVSYSVHHTHAHTRTCTHTLTHKNTLSLYLVVLDHDTRRRVQS